MSDVTNASDGPEGTPTKKVALPAWKEPRFWATAALVLFAGALAAAGSIGADATATGLTGLLTRWKSDGEANVPLHLQPRFWISAVIFLVIVGLALAGKLQGWAALTYAAGVLSQWGVAKITPPVGG